MGGVCGRLEAISLGMAEIEKLLHHDLLHVAMEKAVGDGDEFVKEVIDIFNYIDEDGSATLSKKEMKDCIKQNKMTNGYMKDMDADKGGHVCVEEFVDYFVGLRTSQKKVRGAEAKILKELKKNFRIPADMKRKEKVDAGPTRSYTFDRGTTTTMGGVDPSSVRVGEWQYS